eukprot:2792325-Prymnesium_polylepis.1
MNWNSPFSSCERLILGHVALRYGRNGRTTMSADGAKDGETCCVASVPNGERTTRQARSTHGKKGRPCAAAGRAVARRAVLCARGVRSKHDAEA